MMSMLYPSLDRVLITSANLCGVSLKVILDILGVKLEYNKLTEENRKLYENWLNAKKNKDFDLADSYREILSKNGVL